MHGRGRVFYTSMGHREDVGANKTFQQIVLGGLSWALGDVDAGITPNFHRVTPEAPAGWSPPKAPNRAAGAGETLPTWHNSLKPASSSQSGTLLQFHSSALRRRADVGSKYRLQGAVAKRLRQRIANPPSPVRIRAAPLPNPCGGKGFCLRQIWPLPQRRGHCYQKCYQIRKRSRRCLRSARHPGQRRTAWLSRSTHAA